MLDLNFLFCFFFDNVTKLIDKPKQNIIQTTYATYSFIVFCFVFVLCAFEILMRYQSMLSLSCSLAQRNEHLLSSTKALKTYDLRLLIRAIHEKRYVLKTRCRRPYKHGHSKRRRSGIEFETKSINLHWKFMIITDDCRASLSFIFVFTIINWLLISLYEYGRCVFPEARNSSLRSVSVATELESRVCSETFKRCCCFFFSFSSFLFLSFFCTIFISFVRSLIAFDCQYLEIQIEIVFQSTLHNVLTFRPIFLFVTLK